MIEQQGATHRKDFAKPDVDEEAIMRVMAGEEPEEIATKRNKLNRQRTARKKYLQAKEADQTGLLRTVL